MKAIPGAVIELTPSLRDNTLFQGSTLKMDFEYGMLTIAKLTETARKRLLCPDITLRELSYVKAIEETIELHEAQYRF